MLSLFSAHIYIYVQRIFTNSKKKKKKKTGSALYKKAAVKKKKEKEKEKGGGNKKIQRSASYKGSNILNTHQP